MGLVIDRRPHFHCKRFRRKKTKHLSRFVGMYERWCLQHAKLFCPFVWWVSEQTHSTSQENPSSVPSYDRLYFARTYFHPHWRFLVCGWNGWRKQSKASWVQTAFFWLAFWLLHKGRLNLWDLRSMGGEIHLLVKYLYNWEGSFLASLEPHPSSLPPLFSIYFSLTFLQQKKSTRYILCEEQLHPLFLLLFGLL